jgi:F-type H+-transporting ATPase subunit epsilon
MAGSVQFDLVSPERKLASLAVTEVQIPGADGDMTVMEGHAPAITSLRPGILKAVGPDGAKSYVVTGGFAEVTATGVSVLAERAIPVEEVTSAMMDALIADAMAVASTSVDKATADKAVADLVATRTSTGH